MSRPTSLLPTGKGYRVLFSNEELSEVHQALSDHAEHLELVLDTPEDSPAVQATLAARDKIEKGMRREGLI